MKFDKASHNADSNQSGSHVEHEPGSEQALFLAKMRDNLKIDFGKPAVSVGEKTQKVSNESVKKMLDGFSLEGNADS